MSKKICSTAVLSELSGLFCEDLDLSCFVTQFNDDTVRIRTINPILNRLFHLHLMNGVG